MTPLNGLGGCLGLALVVLSLPATGLAQGRNREASSAAPIPTRFTVDYNSTGGGNDGLGGFEIMQPLHQAPGKRFDYLFGRLNLSHDGEVGGNLLWGTRQGDRCHDLPGECILGGYLGLDFRQTDKALFPQLGVGVEVLSHLEFRLNGYFPLGDTRQRTETGRFVSPTGLQFQGQNLAFLDSNHPNRYQVALSGVELEVGGTLIEFSHGGDLRGYGAVYNYGGQGVGRYWGGQGRLELRPNRALSLGGGVQFDPEFGTNLLFRVAASWPTLAEQADQTSQVIEERLAAVPRRRHALVVAKRSEAFIGDIAIAPKTNKAYEFIHVVPGSQTGGSGTVEAPVTTVAMATELATATTDIIYVQTGQAGHRFTIPAGVAVLSVAPEQQIKTQFGAVLLPGSGQGKAARPLITGTVTMGNDTSLSGFEIHPPINQPGIVSRNSSETLLISDNAVTTQGGQSSGIVASHTGGSATISSNSITTQGDGSQGIDVSTIFGSRLTIANNIVTTHGQNATGLSGSSRWGSETVLITGNTVTTHGDGALGISGFAESRTSTGGFSSGRPVSILGNTVTSHGNQAWGIFGNGNPVLIAGNRVMTHGDDASGIVSPGANEYRRRDSMTMTDNRVTTLGQNADGLYIRQGAFLSQSHYKIINNTIEQAGRDGVRIELEAAQLTPLGVVAKSSIDVNLSHNLSRNPGSGIGYHLINEGDEPFRLIDSSPRFADTQANNIGMFSFEPITAFTQVPVSPSAK